MTRKECIFAEKAPEPGHYSHAVRYGDTLYLSGQVAEDPATGELVTGSIAAQTQRILENIQIVLEAAGSNLDNVLKVTVYLTDINQKPEMNDMYKKFFPKNPPARVAIAVKALDDGLDVEMDAIAGLG